MASKKVGCNSFLAVAIAGAMLHPTYTAMITDAFAVNFSSMFGLPVTLATYSSSVIAALLMVGALYWVEKACDRCIPKLARFFFKPVVCMVLVGALTFIVLGPIGFLVGNLVSAGLDALFSYVPWLVPTVVGAIFPLMVTTGMHYGIVPFMMQSIAAQGFEQICCPGNLPSNIAQGAAALAVSLKSKKVELKETAITAGITAILGTTEPALFGVTLNFKRVLTCVMIGGACGGFYSGITGVKCYAFISPGQEIWFERTAERDDFYHLAQGRFCGEAWDAVSRYVYTALQGGSIMHGWTRDERMMIACCNDGTRPVVFKIERVDVPETEAERRWLAEQDFSCGPEDAYTG